MIFETDLAKEIKRLRSEGLSYKKIAKTVNCSLSLVSYYCSPGQKEKTIERARSRRNRKVTYVQNVKNNKKCSDCLEHYPHYVLEFDHIKGKKKAAISTMAHYPEWSLNDLIDEISKCELVCSNCHKIRTWNRILKTGGDSIDSFGVY